MKTSPIITFENPKDGEFNGSKTSEETLHRICFFMEYSVQDD